MPVPEAVRDGQRSPPMGMLLSLLAVGAVLFLTSPLILEDFSPSRNTRYLSAAALLVGGGLVVRALSGLGRHAFERSGAAHLAPAARIAQLIGYMVVTLVAISSAGYKLSGLLAGGAVLTAVIGLGLQPALSNLFAGLVLNSSRAFRIGDRVSVRSWAFGGSEFSGQVQDITLIHTVLETPIGVMRVPNGRMVDSTIGVLNGLEAALAVTLPRGVLPADLERVIPGIRVQVRAWTPSGLETSVHLPDQLDALERLLGLLESRTRVDGV